MIAIIILLTLWLALAFCIATLLIQEGGLPSLSDVPAFVIFCACAGLILPFIAVICVAYKVICVAFLLEKWDH